jgi:hypothetical protein
MSGKASPDAFKGHLAELEARKARFAAKHPEMGQKELREAYWRTYRGGRTASARNKRMREINDFIRLVKQSQPFWE